MNKARIISKVRGFGGDEYTIELSPPFDHNGDSVDKLYVDFGWGLLMPTKVQICKKIHKEYVVMYQLVGYNLGFILEDIVKLIDYELINE